MAELTHSVSTWYRDAFYDIRQQRDSLIAILGTPTMFPSPWRISFLLTIVVREPLVKDTGNE